MRVLLKDDGNLELILVTELFYDEDGLNFVDYFGNYYVFRGFDRDLATYYIMKLFNNNFVDLSEFKYECYEDYNNEDA